MGARIGLEGHPEAAGAERGDVSAGLMERRPVIPGAVDDQHREVAARLEAPSGRRPTGSHPLIATTPANRSGYVRASQ